MVGVLAFVGIGQAGPAQAADLYRYWTFWTTSGQDWQFFTNDPNTQIPQNGAVEGWRFEVGTVEASGVRAPRTTPSFSDVCTGDVPEGKKQVAVYIDFGTADDAPSGQTPPTPVSHCAVVDAGASSVQVLQATSQTRVEGGLICGIDGFPSSGCGDAVTAAAAPAGNEAQVDFATTSPDASAKKAPLGGWAGALAGTLALLAVLAGIGVAVKRGGEHKGV